MASLVPIPESVLRVLKHCQERSEQSYLCIYDNTYSLFDSHGYQVMRVEQWRNLQRCDGFNAARYRIVASTT